MGLVPAFVFSLNRRAVLAILAITISVAYTLVAGAAVTGLKDAQGALAGHLADTHEIVIKGDVDPFALEELDRQASYGLALHPLDGHALFTVRQGPQAITNASRVLAGPASGLADGQRLHLANTTLVVERGQLPAGAQPGWLGVTQATFQALGGPEAPTVHVAVLGAPLPQADQATGGQEDGGDGQTATGQAGDTGAANATTGGTANTSTNTTGANATGANATDGNATGGNDTSSSSSGQSDQDGTPNGTGYSTQSLFPTAVAQGTGFHTLEAPATFPFYRQGADQVVSTVRVTVLASAAVVGLVTSGFVTLELRARRRSFSTLRLFSGSRYVQQLVAGRAAFLLAAGHVLALAGVLGMLTLLQRVGDIQLALDQDYLTFAATATFAGGLLGAIAPVLQAGKPVDVDRLREREPPAWLPRFARLQLASWRALVPLVASAVILAGSLGVIFGTVDMPTQLFGVEGAEVVAAPQGNPLRGTVDAFAGLHMAGVEPFAASSPEIFAPTTLQGQPLMVRGVAWGNLQGMDEVRLTQGVRPDGPGEAVAGHRLAQRMDLAPGQSFLLPSAYTASATPITVVGVAKAPGLLGDELLVGLPTARALTDLSPDQVNIIRFRTDPTLPANVTGAAGLPSGIQVSDLRVVPHDPVPLQHAVAVVDLVNFDQQNRTRHLTLRLNGEPVADAWVAVMARDTRSVELPFTVPRTGLFNLQVNPSRDVQVADPAYTLQTPPAVTVGSSFTATVLDRDGDPASGVEVSFEDANETTDGSGQATFQAVQVGNRTLFAQGPDGRAADTLLVVEPRDLHRARLVLRTIAGPATTQDGRWSGTATLENVGAETFEGPLSVPVDGNLTDAGTNATIRPGHQARVAITLALAQGTHTIGEDGASMTVQSGSTATGGGGQGGGGGGTGGSDGGTGDGGDGGTGTGDGATGPTIEELLQQRRERSAKGSSADQLDATSAFLGDTVDNLNTALTIVSLATVLHAGLVTWVAVQREVEERAPTVGTLASIGADRRTLRGLALREFGLLGLVAAFVGVLLGLALVGAAATAGWLTGFGHALIPRTSLGFGARILAVALATTLIAAVAAVENVRSKRMRSLMAEGPTRPTRPPLDTLLGGRS